MERERSEGSEGGRERVYHRSSGRKGLREAGSGQRQSHREGQQVQGGKHPLIQEGFGDKTALGK